MRLNILILNGACFYLGTYLNLIASQVIFNLPSADNRTILSHCTIATSKVHLSRGRRRAWYWRARLPWQRDPFAVHSVHHSRLAQCKINVSRAREVCVMLVLNKSNIRKAYRDKYLMFLQLNSFANA